MPSVSPKVLATASLRARTAPGLFRAAPAVIEPGPSLNAGSCRCHHCHRTPLLGERVHLYAEQIVCELCRPRRRREPDVSPLVRSTDHERLVRRT